mmetsp:Transcript_9267/g.17454  ORF Transcript_9267/g.17454 Transcript_9267/m.17454 type:complete len:246 (+) Transcript_9267:1754-2491(+)
MKNMDVMKMATTDERKRDFHADLRAWSTLPLPKWNARRIDAASDKPSVADSKRSHIDSRIPHAATSAGPRAAAKNVNASHSPYSSNDPNESGIAVCNTYFTAGMFDNANVFVIPFQKGPIHPLKNDMAVKTMKHKTVTLKDEIATQKRLKPSIVDRNTHNITQSAAPVITSKIVAASAYPDISSKHVYASKIPSTISTNMATLVYDVPIATTFSLSPNRRKQSSIKNHQMPMTGTAAATYKMHAI